jgi:MFS transporter, YNFM family, putative membrane transport protein
MTAALLGFAAAGILPEGEPARTLRRATWLTVAASLIAALSPDVRLLLPARVAQGIGIGLLVAGGLADVPRRMPPAMAGRVTGAMIAGTALGGLGGRLVGYTGNFLSWRGAFLLGGAGVLFVVLLSLRALPLAAPASQRQRTTRTASSPLPLIVAGSFILFVSVGMFDLLPYRLGGPPFNLPPLLGDLVYLVFVPATFTGVVAGLAIDRFGRRAVILATAVIDVSLMLVGLLPSLAALTLAAAAAISGTVSLHVAHSGAAAAYGRATVGRYLTAYYIGGAAAAPLMAASYLRWGWPGVILPLCAATLIVAGLALVREQPRGAQGQQLDAGVSPAGPPG